VTGEVSPRRSTLLLIGAVGVLVPSLASAHAALVESTPRDGEVIAAAPPAAVLRFNVRIERRLTRATLTGPDGRAIALPGAPVAVEDAPDRVSIPLPPLSPGAYRLTYVVLASDGHASPGLIHFTVGRGPPR
jgi:methionine-rich copper-binding protein CopC